MKVGYARVSTTKAEQDTSLEGQEQQLLAAGCQKVIVERGSAYKGRRLGWDELWRLVASGKVTEVLTIDQSRLSRSGDDLDFLNACSLKGVVVRALTGGVIEADSYAGFVTAGVLSVMNRAQSKLIGAKSKDGVARRRAAGYYGCGKVPFGYQVHEGKVQPHPEHFEAARVMWLQLLEMGMNISGWIKATGMPWTPPGIRKWMANPMLRGAVRGEWGQVEPVITWSEWEASQVMLKARSVIRGQTTHQTYLFTGLVKCEACGKSLHNCRDRGVPRLKCMARHCQRYGQGIRVSVVWEKVTDALVARHEELANEAAVTHRPETPEQQKIRADLANLQQVAHLPGVQELIDRQRAQLAILTAQQSSPSSRTLVDLYKSAGTLRQSTDNELRPILVEFVRSIEWLGGLESIRVTLR